MDLPQHKAGTSVKPDSPPEPDDDCEKKLLKTLSDIADEAQRVKDHWVKDVDLTRDLDLYRGKLNVKQSVEAIRKELPDLPEIAELCRFIESSERGIIR